MINISLDINLSNKNYTNLEEKHLAFLLFMKSVNKMFYGANEILGTDTNNSFKKFFYSLPDEVLNECGYIKNINSFERVEYLIKFILVNNTYDLATNTVFEDLPNTKGLEFLKCTPVIKIKTIENKAS